jgi:hypothetical protein
VRRGEILRHDGSGWGGSGWAVSLASDPTVHFAGVWGRSGSDVFAVGSQSCTTDAGYTTTCASIALRYDGATWTAMNTSLTKQPLVAVWGSPGAWVFAVGAGGTILRYDGGTWKAMSSGTSEYLLGVWGTSDQDVFAVGEKGTVVHYDGTGWQPMTSGTSADLFAVWGSAASNVFAVGAGGTILRYDGATWQPMTSGTTQLLTGVWGRSAQDVTAVGYDGTILRFDGQSWAPGATDARGPGGGGCASLYGVGGAVAGPAFVVGDQGVILGACPGGAC